MSEVSPEIKPIIDYLIGNINEDGYLTDLGGGSARSSSVSRCREVEEALSVVQYFDPIWGWEREISRSAC